MKNELFDISVFETREYFRHKAHIVSGDFYQLFNNLYFCHIIDKNIYGFIPSAEKEEILFFKRLSYNKTKLNTKQHRIKHLGVLEEITFEELLLHSLPENIKTQLMFNINLFR